MAWVDNRCQWRSELSEPEGNRLLYVGFDDARIPADRRADLPYGQGVCPRCFGIFQSAFHPGVLPPSPKPPLRFAEFWESYRADVDMPEPLLLGKIQAAAAAAWRAARSEDHSVEGLEAAYKTALARQGELEDIVRRLRSNMHELRVHAQKLIDISMSAGPQRHG